MVINYSNKEMLKGIQPVMSSNESLSFVIPARKGWEESPVDAMVISLDHLFMVRGPEVLSGLSVCEALLFHNMFCFKQT